VSAEVVVAALPPEVARVLRDAFGHSDAEDLCVLKGGRSGAMLLGFTVAGARWVLRRPDPARPDHEPRAIREIACARIGSERGVAPPLRHADAATGIMIVERVEAAPFGRAAWTKEQRISRVAEALRRLHDGPPFPKGPSPMALLRKLDDALRAQGSDRLPESLVRTMGELSRSTARFAEKAPCHNDLNPGNILEGNDRAYFIDWENACAGDPFLDLGQLGVFAFPLPDDRGRLFEAYLGHPPGEEDRARAVVARVMALGFYAAAFLQAMVIRGLGTRLTAAPLPMTELLALLATQGERASAEVVAVSLLGETGRAAHEKECEEAVRRL